MQKKTIKDQARWNLNMDEGGTHKVLALDEEISKMIAPGREVSLLDKFGHPRSN